MSIIDRKFRELFQLLDDARVGAIDQDALTSTLYALPLTHAQIDKELRLVTPLDGHSIGFEDFSALLRRLLVSYFKLDDLCAEFKVAALNSRRSRALHPVQGTYSALPLPTPQPQMLDLPNTQLDARDAPQDSALSRDAVHKLEELNRALEKENRELRQNAAATAAAARRIERPKKNELDSDDRRMREEMTTMREELERLRVREWVQSNELEQKDKLIQLLEEQLSDWRGQASEWSAQKVRHHEQERHWENERSAVWSRESEHFTQFGKKMDEMRRDMALFSHQCEELVHLTRVRLTDEFAEYDNVGPRREPTEEDKWYHRHLKRRTPRGAQSPRSTASPQRDGHMSGHDAYSAVASPRGSRVASPRSK